MGNSILLLWAVAFRLFLTPAGWQVPKSSSVKRLKSQDWVDWLFWGCHTGVHILQQWQWPILHQPMSPYAPGLCGYWGTGQGGCTAHPSVGLPAFRASLGFRHGAAIRLQGSFKALFSFSFHLMSSHGGFGGWRVTGPTPKHHPKHLDRGQEQGYAWGFFQHFPNATVSSELLNRARGFHSC